MMLLIFSLLTLQALADVHLGAQTFSSVRTRPLTATIGKSAGFFLRVGGVAFGGVAQGEDGWTVSDLHYEPSNEDGERLLVTVSKPGTGSMVVVSPVSDWQLVPIARLAASDSTACVTLFGEEDDLYEGTTELQLELVAEELLSGGRLVLYHEALHDEMLGLRLLQADMLLISEDAAHLFCTEQGDTILGRGESLPNVEANLEAFRSVKGWIEATDEKFQSYVITDSPFQQVTFRPHEGLLLLSGEPYWDCWRWSDEWQARLAEFEETSMQILTMLLAGELTEEQALERMTAAQALVGEPGEQHIVKLPEYSKSLSKLVREKNGVNPAVYSSLQTTMRYGALLRHARQHSGKAFERLLEQLKGVQPSPLPPVARAQVETPGLWKASRD